MQNIQRPPSALNGATCGLLTLASFTLASFALAGCSDSEYKVAPVKGTVTYQGNKLTFGKLYFRPVKNDGEGENPGRPAFGTIDEQGAYRLSTYSEYDGAIVGTHNVQFLTKSESKETRKKKVAFFAQLGEKPPKFLRPKQTQIEIEQRSNVFDIELVEKK